MKTDKVICVKIAQRVIRKGKYRFFPFDRVYLTDKQLLPRFNSLFRYYLYMDLDAEMLEALNGLAVKQTRQLNLQRDNEARKGSPGTAQDNFNGLVPSHEGWIVVVPTHVQLRRKKNEHGKWVPDKATLGYHLSRVLTWTNHKEIQLPRVALHTPQRDIPLLCAVCSKTAEMHAGTCTPGTGTCKRMAEIRVVPESEFSDTQLQATTETGESEWPLDTAEQP